MYSNSLPSEMSVIPFYFAKVAYEYLYFTIFASQLKESKCRSVYGRAELSNHGSTGSSLLLNKNGKR